MDPISASSLSAAATAATSSQTFSLLMPAFADDPKATVRISEISVKPSQVVAPTHVLLTAESEKGVVEVTLKELGHTQPARVTEIHIQSGADIVAGQKLLTMQSLTAEELKASGFTPAPSKSAAPAPAAPRPASPARPAAPSARPAPAVQASVSSPPPMPGLSAPERGGDVPPNEALAMVLTGLGALMRGTGLPGGVPGTQGAASQNAIPFLQAPATPAIGEPYHEAPLDAHTRAMATGMVNSTGLSPQPHEQYDCDVTLLEAHRAVINAGREKGQGITLMAYVIRAMAETLKDHPQVRSALDPVGQRLLVRDYYDVGFAADGAGERLYVPVVRQADQRSIVEISEEIRRLAGAARDGRLSLKDMGKATISVSNMGSLGAETVIPVVNPPEAAIIGMGRTEEGLVRLTSEGLAPWSRLPLTISFDHRFVSGAQAGRFMRDLKARLESIDWLTDDVMGAPLDPEGIRLPSVLKLSPSQRKELRARAVELAERLAEHRAIQAEALGIVSPTSGSITTVNVNTIPASQQVDFPGGEQDLAQAVRLANILRWNVMATVAAANKKIEGLGGHINTLASNADIMVGLVSYFLKRGQDASGRREGRDDDLWNQGHDWPGLLSILNLMGLLPDEDLARFRQQMGYRDASGRIVLDLEKGNGTDSYNHAVTASGRKLARNRSVVMGSGGFQSIHSARVNRYLDLHGLVPGASEDRCWAILGDASMRETEHQSDLDIAARDHLKVRHLVNVNLQGLDGVADGDGNGNLFHKFEAKYRAAGWKVIKVMFDSHWDGLLERDTNGLIARRISEMADGNLLYLQGKPGAFLRENFFGKSGKGKFEEQQPNPELLNLVADLSDEALEALGWGGHDPLKIFNALKEADGTDGPAVVLFRTVKGKSMGPMEASLQTHGEKKVSPKALREIRDRLGAPFEDAELVTQEGGEEHAHYPLWKAGVGGLKGDGGATEAVAFLRARREEMGGPVPHRTVIEPVPMRFSPEDLRAIYGSMEDRTDGERMSTTVALDFVDRLMRHSELGRFFVPIFADETDTVGWGAPAKRHGYFNLQEQGYDSPRPSTGKAEYVEGPQGRVIQVGINEPAGMAVFTALGTAYAKHGLPIIPIFTCYSRFGLPLVGSWFWGAGDVRARGIFIGATNGKTTLLEGPEHADGESALQAHSYPKIRTYDPAFPFDMGAIFRHAIATFFGEGDRSLSDGIINIMAYNQMFPIHARPEGVADEDVVGGLYRFVDADPSLAGRPRVQLIGSGPLLFEQLRARDILQREFGVGASVWNATSPSEIQREAERVRHWNEYHPDQPERLSRAARLFQGAEGPIVVATDHHTAWGGLLNDALPRKAVILGPNGYGPCDDRAVLRRGFGTDAESSVAVSVSALVRSGAPGVTAADFRGFLTKHGIDPDRPRPVDIL